MIEKFKPHIFDDGVNERYHDGIIYNDEVIRNYQSICNLLNEQRDEIIKLQKEKEFREFLANHRGRMVGFATFLIEDMGSEEMLGMWNEFREEMYQEWRKKREIGIWLNSNGIGEQIK